MLDKHNCHVAAFRTARDKIQSRTVSTNGLRLTLKSDRRSDGRTSNLPTTDEVAALIPGDIDVTMHTRDIVIETKTGKLTRISELHPAYLALQYPLLFPYGEDGFRLGIDIGFIDTAGRRTKTVTMRQFFAYRIHERFGESPTILMSGKLYQQFLVDAFTMIETNRLRYLFFNQSKLRAETIDKIQNKADNGASDFSGQGKRIYIPSSYTGGTRYMLQHYLDAMATCKYYGFPDLFITFTCNPKWPEMTRFCERHDLTPEDKADIGCKLFKMKLDDLIYQLTKKDLLGVVEAGTWTVCNYVERISFIEIYDFV